MDKAGEDTANRMQDHNWEKLIEQCISRMFTHTTTCSYFIFLEIETETERDMD